MIYVFDDYIECVSIEIGRTFLVQIEMLLLMLFIVPLIQILEFLLKGLTLC